MLCNLFLMLIIGNRQHCLKLAAEPRGSEWPFLVISCL